MSLPHLSIKLVSNPARSLNRQYTYNYNYNYNYYGGGQNAGPAGYSNYGNGNGYRNQQQNFGNGRQEFDYYALRLFFVEVQNIIFYTSISTFSKSIQNKIQARFLSLTKANLVTHKIVHDQKIRFLS